MIGGKLIHCQKALKWYTLTISFTNIMNHKNQTTFLNIIHFFKRLFKIIATNCTKKEGDFSLDRLHLKSKCFIGYRYLSATR